uniref:Prestin n=1 Tax=Cacopsylla melanoneura TaxID=428564 RepID=A0A8D8S9J3_9HEMI
MNSNSDPLLIQAQDEKNKIFSSYKPYKQSEFDELYHHTEYKKIDLSEYIKNKLKSKLKFINIFLSLFPILEWLPKYDWKNDLSHDLVSGVTVAILHIPQGMAYSSLGGVPPIVGIYMAVFPVIIYIFMGTSRHNSMGTLSVVCIMTSKAVYTYADPRYFSSEFVSDTNLTSNSSTINTHDSLGLTPIQVASAVCITVGIWHLILGLCRLGSLSVLMSDIMISGFTTGVAIAVILSQIKHIFGIKLKRHIGTFNIIYTLVDVAQNIHKTNFVALGVVVSLSTALIIYNDNFKSKVQKKLSFPVPTEMIVIVAGTLISSALDLEHNYNLSNVGNIPIGLPFPQPPPFYLIPNLIVDGLMISIVAFSINISMASILAKKKYKVDSNQELLASGVSNIFGSFFSCIPFASSLSRSLIQLQVGGKTQLASGVSCGLLVLILLYIGPFFEPLPHCVLTSIVIAAVRGMLNQVGDLKLALKESYAEACVWIATFLAVVILNVDYGLGVGVLCSLAFVVITGQKVMVYKLGNLNDSNIYVEKEYYESATDVPGIVILRIIGSVNFINKDKVFNKISKQCLTDTTLPKHIVLDMMSLSSADTSTVKCFLRFYRELVEQGINLHLVKLIEPVKKVFVKCKFFNDFPASNLYPTVHDAVLNCKEY